jgi:hypothetical protein
MLLADHNSTPVGLRYTEFVFVDSARDGDEVVMIESPEAVTCMDIICSGIHALHAGS